MSEILTKEDLAAEAFAEISRLPLRVEPQIEVKMWQSVDGSKHMMRLRRVGEEWPPMIKSGTSIEDMLIPREPVYSPVINNSN